jgi:imidazolonepropionase-like amidohydrolase
VDYIKVWVDDRDGQYEKTSPAQYSAIIDEAHKHGIPVAAHIFSMEDAKGLLRAGIDAFAHGIRDRDIDDETVALFVERPHVVLIPNLPDRGVKVDMSWLRGSIPDGELAEIQAGFKDDPEMQAFFGIQARNMVRLHEAGVKIAMGTDGRIMWEPHVQLADMVAAGMSPADVIIAATRNSAEVIGLHDTGTLAGGMIADFIVLDANPLDDITNTRTINAVYLRGQKVQR